MSQTVGFQFKSRIPTLSDDATIVEALKVYHYGVDNYSTEAIPNDSIEGNFRTLSTKISELDASVLGLGSTYVEQISLTASPNVLTGQSVETVPLTIRAITSQTSSLQQWQSSSSINIGSISTGGFLNIQGYITVGTTTQSLTTGVNVVVGNASHKGITVKAQTSQTANIQEWQNSTGTAIAWVDKDGKVFSNSIESVNLSSSQTLTNKTLTSPVLNDAHLVGPTEKITVSATASTGIINFDCLSQTILFYSTSASADWTLNFRGSSSVSMNTLLSIGESITVTFLSQQGTTAYKPTVFTIDSTTVTPLWVSGLAPVAGNISSIDGYTFTIIKTGNNAFTVLGGQVQFK